MSWMLRNNHGSFKVNPCMRQSGVKRNAETERDRYVTHEEYWAVYEAGGRTVRLLMELLYRTLQRPEIDVLAWTPANVVTKAGETVLRFKTQRIIDIGLQGQFKELVQSAIGDAPVLHQPIVQALKGEAYTYDGASAMLKSRPRPGRARRCLR